MAIEHRQMHLETLAYMFHNFDYSRKRCSLHVDPDCENNATVNSWCQIPEGNAVLGRQDNGSFGWDNEFGEVISPVAAFRIQRFSVTNGEYKQFVDDGNSFYGLRRVPAITHGPRAGGQHTLNEWVVVDDMVRVAHLYALVAALYCPLPA